jgi:hypothetical protein
MAYGRWFRFVSLAFVSYRALVLDQHIYQLDFGRHVRGGMGRGGIVGDIDQRFARLSGAGDPL